VNQVIGITIAAAMKVYSLLGAGLLESAYLAGIPSTGKHTSKACVLHELREQGVAAASQVILPIVYDGLAIDIGYRIDLLVDDLVMVNSSVFKP
jgi:GxxExxY protein